MKSKACRLLYRNTLLVTVTLGTCVMATQHNLLSVNTQFMHSQNMLCNHTTSNYVKCWSQKQPLLWKWSECDVMKFHACKRHMKLCVSTCDANDLTCLIICLVRYQTVEDHVYKLMNESHWGVMTSWMNSIATPPPTASRWLRQVHHS